MSNDLECPYCNAGLEVCHDDGEAYEEDTAHEMECGECEKSFIFYTSISYYYSPHKADCLNDQNTHDYQKLNGAPDWYNTNRRRCSMCDKEIIYQKEDPEFVIPEYEDYMRECYNCKNNGVQTARTNEETFNNECSVCNRKSPGLS